MAYTTIKKSSSYFNTKLYTGDGSSSRGITGVGFATDMVWLKGRTTAYDHRLVDKLRIGTYPDILYPNETSVETEDVNNFVSIDSDGFTIGSGNAVNQSGQTYVAWNWKANGSGSSNTDGSITSTVSANTTSGFSIVSYTGTGSAATVGHGLGTAPKMMIFKNRSAVKGWSVYHNSLGATKFIFLNESNLAETSSTMFNNTAPTSSLFTVGTDLATNVSGNNYIAYCFAEKQGFSKFSSYVGNGNADGTFVYTGFKPAFVFLKNTTNGNRGVMYDNKRLGYNPNNYSLGADVNLAEESASWTLIDTYSNGFKCRSIDGSQNASGNTYIYMAFAEEPLVGDNPATAR